MPKGYYTRGLPKITKRCEYCSVDFIVTPSRQNKARFCSNKCSSLSVVTQIQKKCEHCGIEFFVTLLRAKNSKFCSRQCYSSARLYKGFHHSEETKQKLSEIKLLNPIIFTPEMKQRLSERTKEQWKKGQFKPKKRKIQTMNPCLCGCGTLVKHKFVAGHNMIGTHRTEETKRKLSKILSGRIITEEHKQAVRDGLNKFYKINPNHKSGYSPSEIARKKISETHKGHIVSQETRDKISKSNSGKIRTNEVKKILSESKKRYLNNHPEALEILRLKQLGKHHSNETKQKMSLAHTGKIHSPEAIKKTADSKRGKLHSEEHKKKNSLAHIKFYKEHPEVVEEYKKFRSTMILPVKDTKIEIKIQNFLKELNFDFFKHKIIEIKHSYQCDVFIPSLNMVIECDGDYWHNFPVGKGIDKLRSMEMLDTGYNVLRLWEHEIIKMDINEFLKRMEMNYNENNQIQIIRYRKKDRL